MAVTRDARLLHVDESQTFLLPVREDGTYAQSLPAGEPVRIADAVEAAYGASDGSAAVMWSAAVGGLRKVWLWRPGASDLIPLTSSARGACSSLKRGQSRSRKRQVSRLRQGRGRSRPRRARRNWMGPGCCAGASRWTCSGAAGVEASAGCWRP